MMNFIIPLVLFIAKIRDTLAKANAVSLSAIFTTLTVYSIVVSGLLSMTTIIVDLLIAMTVVITAMFVLALILMNPFTFPAGIALFAVATGILSAIFIPTIIIYVIIQAFMSSVFGKQARPAPETPVGKMKKISFPKIELPKIKLKNPFK
jgi:glucan phosphoethanolaminetransferase (alkaline phosphatase superfamily)